MCVIFNIEDGNFPQLATLKSAESMNSHGGSIAWLEDGKINYHKGLKAKKINKIILKRLKPKGVTIAIIHFRIASIGNVNQKLCHPFQISEECATDLKVEDSKFDLLFHNGTVSDWQELMINHLQGVTATIPKGELSDSRALAYLLSIYDYASLLDQVDGWNKFSILTKDGIKKFGSWVKVDGIECSNNYFDNKKSFYSSNDDYEEVDYLDDVGYGINQRKQWNNKYGSDNKCLVDKFTVTADQDEESPTEFDICQSESDREIFKKIVKSGMDEDSIEYYYNAGYEFEEILDMVKNPTWWENNTDEEIFNSRQGELLTTK